MNTSNNSSINENNVPSTNNLSLNSQLLSDISLLSNNSSSTGQGLLQPATTVTTPLMLSNPLQQRNGLGAIGGPILGNLTAAPSFAIPLTPSIPVGNSVATAAVCTNASAPLLQRYGAAAQLAPPSFGTLVPALSISVKGFNMQNGMVNSRQQVYKMGEIATQYAAKAEEAWDCARNMAAEENLEIPPLPLPVYSMLTKYGSLTNHPNRNQLNDTAQQHNEGLHQSQLRLSGTISSTDAPATLALQLLEHMPSAAIQCTTANGSSELLFGAPSGLLAKRSRIDEISENGGDVNLETRSSSKTTLDGLPVLSPHLSCTARTDQQFSDRDSGVTMSENLSDKTKTSSPPSTETSSYLREQRSWSDSFSVSSILKSRNGGSYTGTHTTDVGKIAAAQVKPEVSVPTKILPLLPQTACTIVPFAQGAGHAYQVPQAPPGHPSINPFHSNIVGFAVTTTGMSPSMVPGPSGQLVPSKQYYVQPLPEQPAATSNENLCEVCGDKASGFHYAVRSCEGCKGFFRRTVQKRLNYKCFKEDECTVDQKNRNRCQSCRFAKCLKVGMQRDSVRSDRGRRRRRDEIRDREVSEVEELRTLRGIIISAYREVYPDGTLIDRREDALERLQMFLDKIPLMEGITSSDDEEKLLMYGLNATLVLRAMFTSDRSCLRIIGDQSETMADFLLNLNFDVHQEELAVMTLWCLFQACSELIRSEQFQHIASKIMSCFRCQLMERFFTDNVANPDGAVCQFWIKATNLVSDCVRSVSKPQKSPDVAASSSQ